MLRQMRFSVHDADATVHRLMARTGRRWQQLQPALVRISAIEQQVSTVTFLGNLVFTDTDKKQVLEAILHPLVRQYKDRFIKQARQHRKSAVFLDVPLLFETGGDQACDLLLQYGLLRSSKIKGPCAETA